MYKIVRVYLYGGSRTIRTGLTEREAQQHCSNPETSSSTCTSAVGRRRTKRLGPWMDCYESMSRRG